MPEGDTIHRTAIRLRQFVLNERFSKVTSRDPSFPVTKLVDQTICDIEARGKHLLIHFENDTALHSHMGMTGSWHLYPKHDAWKKPHNRAALIFENERLCIVCFSPKTLELLSAIQLRRHRYLSQLGPDLLATSISMNVVLQRFRQYDPVSIGEAVMNQTIVSGIGNVYKSETLFLSGLHPKTPVGQLTTDQLEHLMKLNRDLMKRNLDGRPRQTRFAGSGQKVWVYGRRGEACHRCGDTIDMIRQGDLARSTYWCPTCQPQVAVMK